MPGAVGAPLITAVMQRSMQSYLEREVRIPSGAAEYSRALIDQGYETPELFHQLSNAQLQKKFRWKEGHIAALNLFVENNPDVKAPAPPKEKAKAKEKEKEKEKEKAEKEKEKEKEKAEKAEKPKRKRAGGGGSGPSEKVSQYIGVSWNKSDQKWRVGIFHDGAKIGLGRFDDDAEAAKVYDEKARELRGAEAKLNFPKPGERQGVGRTLRTSEEVRAAKAMGPKRSAYRGVCWDKQPGKWKAQIKEPVTKRVKHLGLFVIEDEAAQAYDDAERSMRGANAELNFPGPGEKQAKPRTTRTKEEAEAAKLLPKQKSSHRGVTWDAARGKWKVAINPQNGKKSQYLGRFDDEQEAAHAYNLAASELAANPPTDAPMSAAPPIRPPPPANSTSKRQRK